MYTNPLHHVHSYPIIARHEAEPRRAPRPRTAPAGASGKHSLLAQQAMKRAAQRRELDQINRQRVSFMSDVFNQANVPEKSDDLLAQITTATQKTDTLSEEAVSRFLGKIMDQEVVFNTSNLIAVKALLKHFIQSGQELKDCFIITAHQSFANRFPDDIELQTIAKQLGIE